MKSAVFAVVVAISASALAQDGTTSVLVNNAPTPAAATTSAAPAECSEAVREVRLTQWQARRLARQADRQEARDACECCKCECCKKKDCRPTALVPARKTACKCNCGK